VNKRLELLCIKGARVIFRDLKTEPSLLVVVLILFAAVLGFQYTGGSEALMALVAAIVIAYGAKIKKKNEKDQEHFDRRIERIQKETYVWLGIALAVSNFPKLPFNQYLAYGIAIAAIFAFIHKVANAEADITVERRHGILPERSSAPAESYGHTVRCRMIEEQNQKVNRYAIAAAPLHYGLSRNETACDCLCHVTQSYRVPQS
jgi:hypothetical protein